MGFINKMGVALYFAVGFEDRCVYLTIFSIFFKNFFYKNRIYLIGNRMNT